ncbi:MULTISPECIES: LysR substrate-binding domain-containing protein [Clostridium]|uniref:LysR substrate-binding domain-containing protein n=1 Tax=Clostridium TaxID=1485 RepID=UPI0008256B8C|nr:MULTISPECIES: LysR substrate-binding domain-containing protein [Clostridium]PJI07251.1 LysR family transcriptional regulator [Clostridium sp. CT7]
MDIKQLSYFLEIAKEGNITKASEKLHITQPHLSLQLKLLEEELNVKLIDRTTRKFQITEAGKTLQKRGEQIIEFTQDTVKELRNINKGVIGTLAIGSITAEVDTLLLKRVNEFHKTYPNINFTIRERHTNEILQLLEKGMIDIGIVRTPLNSMDVEAAYLHEESMVAVYCNDEDWKENKKTIDIIELYDRPLLVNFRYEKDIINACKRAGFEPRIICRINDARSILLWANTGMGVAVVPKDWLNAVPNIDFKYKEINEKYLVTQTAIIWSKKRYLSPLAKKFLKTFNT